MTSFRGRAWQERAGSSAVAAAAALAAILGVILAAILASPGAAVAQEDARPTSEGGTISLTVENDLFAGADKDYTNGVRLDYITPRNELSAIGRRARGALTWLTDADDWYEMIAVGQNMYTPSDIGVAIPPPDERPYAGFLYASFGLAADRGDRLDTIAIDIGITGEPSGAEDAQTITHEIIGATKPLGWDTQLDTEVAFRVLYERKNRFGFRFDLPVVPVEFDAAPHVSVALGTVDTSAAAGLTVRAGFDLADDYGPPRVRPAVSAPGFFRATDGFSGYVFAGAEGRAVGRNLFLEGNTFGGVDGVTPNRFVADFQLGAAVQYGPVELAYTQVFRSEEYQAQDGFSLFGSVNLRTKF